VRQLTFEFVARVRYLIRFPAKVEKELVGHMARAITEVAKAPKEGGRDENRRGEQQDN
jgi:hypothetical protein